MQPVVWAQSGGESSTSPTHSCNCHTFVTLILPRCTRHYCPPYTSHTHAHAHTHTHMHTHAHTSHTHTRVHIQYMYTHTHMHTYTHTHTHMHTYTYTCTHTRTTSACNKTRETLCILMLTLDTQQAVLCLLLLFHTCRRSVQWVLVCHSMVQPCTSGVWPRNVRAMADPLRTTDSGV